MGLDEDLMRNYAINENVLTSDTVDSNAKYAAWRNQAATLQHLNRNLSPATQHVALGQHLTKLSFDNHADFLQQRAKSVDAYLDNFPKSSEPKSSWDSLDFTVSDFDSGDELFEGSCAGPYQSCRYNEMNEDVLKIIQTTKEVKDCVTSGGVEEVLILQNQDKSTKITSARKNTLSAFLKRQTPPTKNLAEEGATTSAINHSGILRDKRLQQSKSTDHNIDNLMTFRTAREELMLQNMKKNSESTGRGKDCSHVSTPLFNYASTKKSLGARRTVNSNFVLPLRTEDRTRSPTGNTTGMATTMNRESPSSLSSTPTSTPPDAIEPMDARLTNIDAKMVELITNEIMHKNQSVDWDDIAGLDYAKSIIKEAVVYPLLRPDIFTGLRRPPRGILLFGPPGTGKTLIGKCIASKSKSTFFSISASSLTSKWVGDGEKMVRALFAVAAVHQPSVVFIDEIDSLLSQRSETEHESSRRLKTEFLVQLDGAATSDDDRILIVGATNRPQELDEAARRRLVRRLYIPLPELEARIQILTNLLQTVRNNLTPEEVREIGDLTVGYSGADMESLCREASMEPIRSIPADDIPFFKVENVRSVKIEDFRVALHNVRPSVSPKDLKQYVDWNRIYGAGK